MSPSPGHAPRTPNTKGSSFSLLGSLKSLAGVRLQNDSSPVASFSNSSLSDVQATLRGYQDRAGGGPGSKPSKTHAEAPGASNRDGRLGKPLVENTVVLGAPPDLERLLRHLQPGQKLYERIAAAARVCDMLHEYPVKHVAAIWTAAQELVESAQSPEAIRAGYDVLRACVMHCRLSPLERRLFFESLLADRALKDVGQRFELIKRLTDNGSNIEAVEDLVAPLITQILKGCYETSAATRKRDRKQKTESSANSEANLGRVCQLISELIKYNSKLFGENDLETLLSQTLAVCTMTTSKSDIENSLGVIDSFLTYAYVPKTALRPCLEVLCGIHYSIQDLGDHSWNDIVHLVGSHWGQSAVNDMIQMLHTEGSNNPKGRADSHAVGAVQVLRKLLVLDGADNVPEIPLGDLIVALKASLPIESECHKSEIIALLSEIFANEALTARLLEEEDWSDLVDIALKCLKKPRKTSLRSGNNDAAGDADTHMLDEGGKPSQAIDNSDLSFHFVNQLAAVSSEVDFIHRAYIMEMFSQLGDRLSNDGAETLVKYHVQERLLFPSNQKWLHNSQQLLNTIFMDSARTTHTRKMTLDAFLDAFKTVDCLCPPPDVRELILMILECIPSEEEPIIFQGLAEFAVAVAELLSDELVVSLFKTLQDATLSGIGIATSPPDSSSGVSNAVASSLVANSQHSDSVPNLASKALVRLFIRSVNRSAKRAEDLFKLLVQIASSETYETAARITSLKLLFRLRSDINHAIFIISSAESKRLAASLCRTVDTSFQNARHDEAFVEVTSKSDKLSSRSFRNSPGNPGSGSRTSSRAGGPNKLTRPTAPLWLYPGPKGLPEEPPAQSSPLLRSYTKTTEGDDQYRLLDIKVWLKAVIAMMEKGTEWEVYSYVLVHLGAQLANQSLFANAIPQVKELRRLICEQLRNASFYEPPAFTNLRKGDVAICMYHVLTMLISYHSHFTKPEQDEVVSVFLLGIGTWDRTWKSCVHALTICCHELPASIAVAIAGILHKMSQIITQSHMAEHVLEFLACLARLPNLYKDFVYDEFKQVFAICFRYLEYMRDQRNDRVVQSYTGSSQITAGHSSGGQSAKTSPEADRGPERGRSSADDLPQYVYALTYHVMAYWFMALRLQDRPKIMPFVAKGLVYTDRNGTEVIEDQAQVTIDMMQRVAYSDRDETAPDPSFAKPSDGILAKKTWLVGLSLLTIETAGRTGASQITQRTPSGTNYSQYRPHLISPPRHQAPITVGSAADAFFTPDYVGILPDAIFLKLYGSLMIPPLSGPFEQLVQLPDDEVTLRAIAGFDRNAPVDGHKIGVIYNGEGQTTEAEILSNVMGSHDYNVFLEGLGTLTRLKGARFNTQGLDRESDSDGEFTFCWRDRVTEVVYHITTMMPTNLDHDPKCTAKKRHTGNDFVNIIWNNSGAAFNFDTFPSDFNYVNIVITPEARRSFVETRMFADADCKDHFYKVQTMCKPGFPEISPAAETKIISGKSLSTFVRLLALNASVFSLAWANRDGGEHVSSWRNRLLEIKRLRDRYISKMMPVEGLRQSPVLSGQRPASASQLSLIERSSIRDSVAAKRTSGLTQTSEGNTNRSSIWSLAPEMERQSSESSRG